MIYETVFDTATAGFRSWPFVVGAIVLTLAGAKLVADDVERGPLLGDDPRRTAAGCFAWAWFLGVLTWSVATLSFSIPQYFDLRNASLQNECTSVAGQVADFRPAHIFKRARESFSVSSVRFEYSDHTITGGFNHTRAHRGPIRENMSVRLCYVQGVAGDNVIIGLEVAR